MLKLTESLDGSPVQTTESRPPEATKPVHQPIPRSPAQRVQSRINGRHSRGPKSARGKAVSRQNAYKHGLRAHTLGPPRDFRGLDKDYKHHVTELTREFTPGTYSVHLLIADLARDYQRRDFCNRLIDIVEMPPALRDAELTAQYEHHERAERDAQAVAELLAALRSGEAPDFEPDTALRLAEQVVGLVDQVEEEWNEEAAAELAGYEALEKAGELASLDADELAELREWEALAKAIKPRRRMLRDDARLADTFRGDRPVIKAEIKTLIILAVEIHTHAAGKAAMTRHVLDHLGKAVSEREHVLAFNPKLLFDLEAYHQRLSRAIGRKTRELRELCK